MCVSESMQSEVHLCGYLDSVNLKHKMFAFNLTLCVPEES